MKFVSDFEKTVADLVVAQGYKNVISVYIHQPKMIRNVTGNGSSLYLHSGGWIENRTTLEYLNKKRELIYYHSKKNARKEGLPLNSNA